MRSNIYNHYAVIKIIHQQEFQRARNSLEINEKNVDNDTVESIFEVIRRVSRKLLLLGCAWAPLGCEDTQLVQVTLDTSKEETVK